VVVKGFDITDLVELDDDQRAVIAMVRDFVARDVMPTASDLEHADEYPTELVAKMKELGLFGVAIPEEYGGAGMNVTSYALIQVELSRGWMSLSGVLNTHSISAWMIKTFGTEEQKQRYLPRMATGELHCGYSMTEPHAGSDVQAIRTRAVRDGDDYLITGEKMWATNGLASSLIMLLAKTDPDADPRHRGMTAFIVEKEPDVAQQPGLTVPPKLRKLGYKGVESTELVFDEFRVPADSVLGGVEGQGFKHFMGGIELGRVNVAARAIGIATAALDEAIKYARDREAFGKPIAKHQLIQQKLALMATKLQASRLLMLHACAAKDAGKRADLEAGMAKLFATETAAWVALESMRVHGGYGYSQEYLVERLYRDAPLLILGEGTNEIQQLVIAQRLMELAGS
jgi:alkylation response protein AidB-like acyl-CoA dehydrogenase